MNRYVIAAPAAVTEVASWAPFADEIGMGYLGMLPDGTTRMIRLTIEDDALVLIDNGEPIMSFKVGEL